MKAKDGYELPRRSTIDSAAYDFFAPEDIHLVPGQWTDVDTGVSFDGEEKLRLHTSFELKALGSTPDAKLEEHTPVDRWFLMCLPRSGQGFRHKVRFANTAGIVDQDYRQTIKARLTADDEITIPKGTAFMQGIFLPYLTLEDEIIPTEERKGGFGSTDRKGSE